MPQIDGLDIQPGLYHYAPKEHGLERRAAFAAELIARLLAPFPPGAFIFGLSSVHWREAWKYGERAFRYCNHDIGHALGSARVAAATLGWNMALLDGVDQNTVALVLGTHRPDDFADVEPEHPDCLCVLWPSEAVRSKGLGVRSSRAEMPLFLDAALVKNIVSGSWQGKANRLSGEHGVHWDAIDQVADASWKVSSELQALSGSRSVANDVSRVTSDAARSSRRAGARGRTGCHGPGSAWALADPALDSLGANGEFVVSLPFAPFLGAVGVSDGHAHDRERRVDATEW